MSSPPKGNHGQPSQQPVDYSEQSDYIQQPTYGQQPPYGQQPTYGQQSAYIQQPGYVQQPIYGHQVGFGHPPIYSQQPAYGQQPEPGSSYPKQTENVGYGFHSNFASDGDRHGAFDDDGGVTFGSGFTSTEIRHAFIRKVYLILTLQLSFTVCVICVFLYTPGVKKFVRVDAPWLMWIAFPVFIVTYFALVCCPSVRRKWPANFIVLFIFTAAMAYLAGTISSYYDTKIVFIAAGATAGICLLISLFAVQTTCDFTGCGVFLCIASIILVVFGMVAVIISVFYKSNVLFLVYSAGIVLLFSMYLVYDTQQIVGGRKYEISPEEHIYASVQLYLDIVQIFLAILTISDYFSG